jgi:hypothetical protein
MKSKILGLLAAGLLAGPMAAQAAAINTTLNGVQIGSTIYNVTFWQDSTGSSTVDGVFGGPPPITFSNSTDALAAANAVVTAGDAANFDYTPATGFNPSLYVNGFALVFAVDASTMSWVYGNSDTNLLLVGVGGPLTQERSTRFGYSFAVFEAIAAVPEPGTLALLGLGLAGLGLSRRRKAA